MPSIKMPVHCIYIRHAHDVHDTPILACAILSTVNVYSATRHI